MTPPSNTKLEQETRQEIDNKLEAAGWVIQDKNRLNLYQSLGVAVREMGTDTGPADYMLFIDGKACDIIGAKREGAELGHVADQSGRYATSGVNFVERWSENDQPLPFLYEATNHEIRFRDERDPHPRSRYVFHFHKPETLHKWLTEDLGWAEEGSPTKARTLRARFHDLPEPDLTNPRDYQINAIHVIEEALKADNPRALLQNDIYRIINSTGTNIVAHQCVTKGRAPGMARDKTEFTEHGKKIEVGTAVANRDRLTKQKRLEVLDHKEWHPRKLETTLEVLRCEEVLVNSGEVE